MTVTPVTNRAVKTSIMKSQSDTLYQFTNFIRYDYKQPTSERSEG